MKSYPRSAVAIFSAAAFIFIAANSSKAGAIIGQLPRPAADAPASTISISQPVLNSGDNAWMLASCALVLMMTAPGLILFYGGLVRAKNVLATMMHSLILMALVSMVWMIFGYSMAFAPGNAFVGNPLTYFMLNGVGGAPNPDYSSTVPQETFMLFQMMFAIITPALISGAMAERIKFKGYVLFILLWVTVVYFPLCHMVWGTGGYFNWALGGKIPVLDFAGGTVVHVSSGVSALVCAILLGHRAGYLREPMMPHNVVLSLIGTGLLWVGWFGFNAGSALTASTLATSAFAATHFSAAAGALSWAFVEWCHKGKPSVLGAASGMIAGLATITPASGFVTIPSAFCIGLAGGAVCYFAVTKFKAMFAYDDALDVFGVHGVGSAVGLLSLGGLASAAVNPAIANTFHSNGVTVPLTAGLRQLGNQGVAVVFTAVYAGVITLILFKVVDALVGLRVDIEDESLGLDLTQHGERAYSE
ncbi:MAG TPA: ammonium transporter [Verrucomicrobiae bacterium]|jgi:Amt family ammonium transporter|nr:ammonium transporter [Verrucomicrobiae bacterium]